MVWSQTWSWSISWTVWPRLSREEQWFGPNRSWGPTVYETLDIHDPQFSQWPLLGCARYRWGGWDSEELSDCWLAHNQHGVEPSASSSSIESRLEPRSSKLHTKCFDGKLVSPALLTSGSTGVQALPASLPDSRLPTLHQFQWPLCYHWGNLPKFMWSIRGCATHTHTHTHTQCLLSETTSPVLPLHCPGKGLPENGVRMTSDPRVTQASTEAEWVTLGRPLAPPLKYCFCV